MKLAFSSAGCPGWGLAKLAEKAKEFGYDGLELRGLRGQLHLPVVPELAAEPERIAALMREAGLEIVCLATSAAFHMTDPRQVAENQAQVREYVELAAQLECPFVRVFGAEIPKARLIGYEPREVVLKRIADAVRELAPHAADQGVTILIQNSGDFVDSASIWYLVDAVDSTAVKCCWDPLAAQTRGERPTTSIPRLTTKIGLVHIADGRFDGPGVFNGHALPGQGQVEIPRMVQLLRGVGYRGYLVFDWPKLWNPSLADPDKALPAAAGYLRALLDEKPVQLTAYKGDKRPPRQGYEAVAS